MSPKIEKAQARCCLQSSKYRHRQTPKRRCVKETINPRRLVYTTMRNCIVAIQNNERCVSPLSLLFFEIGDFVFQDKAKNALH